MVTIGMNANRRFNGNFNAPEKIIYFNLLKDSCRVIFFIYLKYMKNQTRRTRNKRILSRKRGGPHYPLGTQKSYNSFSLRNIMMGKGKELESPEGWGGGKREQRSPGVPPRGGNPKERCCMCGKRRKKMLIPAECLIKYGAKRAHKICERCWWDEFAIEGASHKCLGCVNNTPVLPDPHKNTIIDLTAETP
jgi:hypothetical protein